MEALYALKKYLEGLAFSGIHNGRVQDKQYQSILAELKRFESSSPVIGRIINSMEILCDNESDGEEDKRLLLLKILELVNAVIYTQGFVGVEGEFIPLVKGVGKSLDMPYCYFASIISAMQSNNRCNRDKELSECFMSSPEMFKDYRIRRQLVLAIGDLYKPVYNIIHMIIVDGIGAEIIPMLDVQFKQTQSSLVKKRTIETIGKIKSSEANNWLKTQLSDKNSKDYRAEIITELSNFDENQDYLLKLAKTEKKRNLKAVVMGLRVDRPESLNVLKQIYSRNHSEDINLLVLSKISEYYKDRENDWYLNILQKASFIKLKGPLVSIRQAIFRVLRYSDQNVDLLVELSKSNKEPCRDELLAELLYYDSDGALDVWNHELRTSKTAFQRLYKILHDPDHEYLKDNELRIRPLLPRLIESIKKYGTDPTDPCPISIMLEMPVIKKTKPNPKPVVHQNTSINHQPECSPKSKEVDSKSNDMYQKLQGFAGGSVFGALKSIFNNKTTLKIANTVLNKVNSETIESEKGQAILSVAQKFISDQNETYEQEVLNKHNFVVDPDDPWSWCLSQLETARDSRLEVILRKIMENRSQQCCTDALVHSIYYMKPGIERRHVLLSVLLYMQTQKAKDYWYEEINSGKESLLRLKLILRNVSNGRFYKEYFGEQNLTVVPMAVELLACSKFNSF